MPITNIISKVEALCPTLHDFTLEIADYLAQGGRLSDTHTYNLLKKLKTPVGEGFSCDKPLAFNYERNVIFSSKDLDIILISWPPSSQTKVHNHARYGCLVKILHGVLVEKHYSTDLVHTNTHIRRKGDISYIDDSLGYHSIQNKTSKGGVGLHIYSPPGHKPTEWSI